MNALRLIYSLGETLVGDLFMARAIVLINTDVGTEEAVLEQLQRLPEVKEVHVVYGVYDLVVFLEANDHNELRSFIATKLRRIPYIRNTTTMIVVDTLSKYS